MIAKPIPKAWEHLYGNPFDSQISETLDVLGIDASGQGDLLERVTDFFQSQIGQQTRGLGFNPQTFVPESGAEHEAHWQQLLQAIFESSDGFSMYGADQHLRGIWQSCFFKPDRRILGIESINETLEILQSLGIPSVPQSLKLRRLLAHLVTNYFANDKSGAIKQGYEFPNEHRDKTIATILTWVVKKAGQPLVKTPAVVTSFGLLQEVAEELGDNIVMCGNGITIIGKSGMIYLVKPKFSAPHFQVIDKRSTLRICLQPLVRQGYPLGDVLTTLISALHDDLETAKVIELLAVFIRATRKLEPCLTCGEEMPHQRLNVHPTRCASCVIHLFRNIWEGEEE